MIQKIKMILLSLSLTPLLAVPALVPASVSADHNAIHSGLCQGANLQLDRNGNCVEVRTGGFQGALTTIINILSVLIGVIAVIMIIWGGFKYITSSGKAESVQSAKNTILYALIGLIIVALAQAIVRFVLTETPRI